MVEPEILDDRRIDAWAGDDPPVPFAWHWEITAVADRSMPLAVASDADAMLIDACERQDAGETGVVDPFWATTWRAARGLDLHLGQLDLTGRDVLEVGCGTGHAGIAAAIRGARVRLTDGVADPLQLVRRSLRRAGLNCPAGVLRLGLDELPGRFDHVIGSDVTYLRELWPQLLRTAASHLKPGGSLLLSDPHRIIATEFRDWARGRPVTYRERSVRLEDDAEHPIRVMMIQFNRCGFC